MENNSQETETTIPSDSQDTAGQSLRNPASNKDKEEARNVDSVNKVPKGLCIHCQKRFRVRDCYKWDVGVSGKKRVYACPNCYLEN